MLEAIARVRAGDALATIEGTLATAAGPQPYTARISRLDERHVVVRLRADSGRARTRRLQMLNEKLSGALEQKDVTALIVSAGREAVGADAGFAWILRDDLLLEHRRQSQAERPD